MAATGSMTVAAICIAADSGEHDVSVPKAFRRVRGLTLLELALRPFTAHAGIRDVVVVAPAARVDETISLAPSARVVAGGASREESVSCGLVALASDIDTVLVHDADRPFVPSALVDRVLAALAAGADAVVPVLPVTDTIKRVDATGVVIETLDRSALVNMQTPQGFRRTVLAASHARARDATAADDATLIEASGGCVVTVDGADEAFKIARPWDLMLAEAVVADD